ncbi:class B sortase [Granulicatella sp.]
MKKIIKIITISFILFFINVPLALADELENYNPIDHHEEKGFYQLEQKYPDVKGWISIDGTHIDYPLLQSEDNVKYLEHNAFGDYIVTGSIFLDYRFDAKFKNFNTIIYGHHVPTGDMFGDIKKFTNKDFFDTHRYGTIYYNGEEKELEIFGILEVDAYDMNIYRPLSNNREENQAYYQYLLSKATYKRDVSVTSDDKICLLSTCFVDVTNGRHILLAKINPVFKKEQINSSSNPTNLPQHSGVSKWIIDIVLLLLVMIIILLVIIIILLRRSRVKK